MRPSGMVFDGSTVLRAYRQLRTIAGNVTRFPEFRPRRVTEGNYGGSLAPPIPAYHVLPYLGKFRSLFWGDIRLFLYRMSVCRHEMGAPSKLTISETAPRGIFQSIGVCLPPLGLRYR